MKRIKVVHIVPMLSPGGAERVAVHLATGMNSQRYEAAVISLMGRMDCDLDRDLDAAGVEVRYLGKHLGFDYRMYSRVFRTLRELRADVIHTHLQVLRYVFPCAAFLKQGLLVHTVHNLAEREIEPAMRWLQGYALRHGVIPVAVADVVASSLRRTYGIPMCGVIANCIPTNSYARPKITRNEWRARVGFGEGDVLFVCVARFAPQKNHSMLLKAFSEGTATNRNAHLVLIGDGVLREQLEREAVQLGISGQTHFLGLRADIPESLGAADVFVLSSDFEGNPLSVMEAMASGLPIVSTAVGGVPALFENYKQGLLVRAGDVLGLSTAMAFLSENKETRRKLGAAAARRAREKFDLSLMVESYENLYDQVLGRARRMRPEAYSCEDPSTGPAGSRGSKLAAL